MGVKIKSGDGPPGPNALLIEDNESIFRSLFTDSSVGIAIAGRDGKFIRANAALCSFLQYTEQELQSLSLRDLTHPDEVAESLQQLQALMRGRRSTIEIENRYLRKDGEVVWGQVTASVIGGADTLPVLMFAMVQDIGWRKRADCERKRVSQFVERLVDSAQAIVLVIGTDGKIVQFNRYMEELSGYELDEVVGQDWFETFAPSTERERRRFLFLGGSDETSHRGNVTEIMTRDGQSRLIQWSADLLRDVDGAVSGILSIGIDITKQREAEGEARLEKERNRAILASVIDGIVTISEQGVIESFNPSAEKIFGYWQDEIVGQDVEILIPQYSRELDRHLATRTESRDLTKLVGVGSEQEGRHKNGTIFPIHLSLAAMEFAEQWGYCALIRDLSESKKVEEHLRQSQRLEAIGSLASGVAHDFNNLLMGVIGCASIAIECADTGRSNRTYLAELLRAAESGKAMTQQLLAFSRNAEVVLEDFGLDSLVVARQELFRRLLGEDVEVVVDLRAGDTNIRADAGKIEQVLMNLVVNARDAMPTGGRLVIATSCVTLEGASGQGNDLPDGSYVVLTVSDNGVGMSAETRRRLFEPFYSTKEPGKGTGLGLSMVYGNVKQFGGQIQVHSVASGGTLFEILLPAVAGKLEAKEIPLNDFEAAHAGQKKEPGTILLCEDDRLVGMAVGYYLEGAGYRVLRATCGAAAIECCREFSAPIDLLLTDIVLPDQGGNKAAEEICRIKPGIKVLYMSAHASDWLKSEGRIDDQLETLQKPISKGSLLLRIAEVLKGQDTAAPKVPSARENEPMGAVLVVDDDQAVRLSLSTSLREMGYEVLTAIDGSEAVEIARAYEGALSALVVDVVLPKVMGVAVAKEVEAIHPGIGVVYMSGYSEDVALQRELVGDAVFVKKPVGPEAMDRILQELRGARKTRANPGSRGSILVVEDYATARLAIADYLSSEGWRVLTAADGAEAMELARAGKCHFDVLLVDYSLPDMKGDHLARQMSEIYPELVVAYMSGYAELQLEPPGPLFTKPMDLELLATTLVALPTRATKSAG